jgi:hypothetical protein
MVKGLFPLLILAIWACNVNVGAAAAPNARFDPVVSNACVSGRLLVVLGS